MTLRLITLSILLLSLMAARIMTLSTKTLSIMSKPNDIQHMSSFWVYSNAWSDVQGYFTINIKTLRSVALSILPLGTMVARIMTLRKMTLSIMSKPNDIQHKILTLATVSIITYYKTHHNDNKHNNS
jgi:hypothetical protein